MNINGFQLIRINPIGGDEKNNGVKTVNVTNVSN